MSTPAQKRQKVEQLTPREWVLKRPETYLGPVSAAPIPVLHAADDGLALKTVEASQLLHQLGKELAGNALDNALRDPNQKYISFLVKDDGTVVVANDGCTPPFETLARGVHAITAAFGEFQAGSNFDDDAERYTQGRNGLGGVCVNVFAKKYAVVVENVDDPADGKTFAQTWTDNMSVAGPARVRTGVARLTANKVEVQCCPTRRARGRRASAGARREPRARGGACAPPHVRVTLNRKAIRERKPEQVQRPGPARPLRRRTSQPTSNAPAHRGHADAAAPESPTAAAGGLTSATSTARALWLARALPARQDRRRAAA